MKRIFMKHRNDCYTCCLAMILGLEYVEVPRFLTDTDEENELGFNQLVDKFLNERGMQRICISVTEEWLKNSIRGYIIAITESPLKEYRDKGLTHAVIYKDGEFFHDPKQYSEIRMKVLYVDLIIPIIGD